MAEPTVFGQNTIANGTCGVDIFFKLSTNKGEPFEYRKDVEDPLVAKGTGYFLVGFIAEVGTSTVNLHEDIQKCKEGKKVYPILCKKSKMVYQSEVRVNKNSKNKFFFCIFDKKQPGTK